MSRPTSFSSLIVNGYSFGITGAMPYIAGVPAVLTTGAQTISGSKTFASTIKGSEFCDNSNTYRVIPNSGALASGAIPMVVWASGALNTMSNGLSVDWNNRATYFDDGQVAIDWANQICYNPGNYHFVSVDWGNNKLYHDGGVSVDWKNSELKDFGESTSVNWHLKQLKASSITTVSWENCALYGSLGAETLNWLNKTISNGWQMEVGVGYSNIASENYVTTAIETKAEQPLGVSTLSLSISDPPTQSEVTQLKNKINELINTLNGAA